MYLEYSLNASSTGKQETIVSPCQFAMTTLLKQSHGNLVGLPLGAFTFLFQEHLKVVGRFGSGELLEASQSLFVGTKVEPNRTRVEHRLCQQLF